MTKYCQKLLNVFAGENVWHCIVSFLNLLSYKWRIICFKSYGKSSSWETSNFQKRIFLTSRLLISASNDAGENFYWTWYLCERSTRSLSVMDKLFPRSQHGPYEAPVKAVMDSQHLFYAKQWSVSMKVAYTFSTLH